MDSPQLPSAAWSQRWLVPQPIRQSWACDAAGTPPQRAYVSANSHSISDLGGSRSSGEAVEPRALIEERAAGGLMPVLRGLHGQTRGKTVAVAQHRRHAGDAREAVVLGEKEPDDRFGVAGVLDFQLHALQVIEILGWVPTLVRKRDPVPSGRAGLFHGKKFASGAPRLDLGCPCRRSERLHPRRPDRPPGARGTHGGRC